MGFVEGNPGAVLITEYSGATPESVSSRVDALAELSRQAGVGYTVVKRLLPDEVNAVWSVRKEALGLIMNVEGDFEPLAFIEDASVPVEHLADYIQQLDEFISSTGTPVVYYAHASAGCLHVRPFMNTKSATEIAKMKRISRISMELVRSFGGAVSSEHGDGLARSLAEPGSTWRRALRRERCAEEDL